ncbi:Peptidoglycan D,D-transpeptidase FtsI [Streptomyces microflavus]
MNISTIVRKSNAVSARCPNVVMTNEARYAIVERTHIATISPYARSPSEQPVAASSYASQRPFRALPLAGPHRHRLQPPCTTTLLVATLWSSRPASSSATAQAPWNAYASISSHPVYLPRNTSAGIWSSEDHGSTRATSPSSPGNSGSASEAPPSSPESRRPGRRDVRAALDYTKQYVNNATRRDYQVGSTFKPFVFTSAVANDSTTLDGRRITPETYYDGTNKRTVQGPQGSTGYEPANEDDVDYGQITVRTATDKSVNSVYAQMAQDVGPDKVRETALALGIPKTTPDLTASPSIALGPATASVLDLTEAYATLANHGRHSAYTLVEKITKDGTEIELPDRKTEQTVTREAADTTTALLRSVVEGGTGSAAQAAGRPAVGKTGTAEEDKAAWFAGYTPDLATVVAVMGQDPESGVQTPLYGALGLDRVNGGGVPAETWAAYTEAALRSSPAQEFDLETAPGSDEPQEPGDEETGTTEPVTPDDSPTGTSPSAPTATTPSAPASSTPPSSDTGTGATGGTTGGTDGGTTGDTGDGGTGDDTGGGTGGGTDDGGTGALGGGFIEGVRGTRDPAG